MTAPALAPFLGATEAMDLAALEQVIQGAVDDGHGFFTYPPPEGSREWPAATRIELTLFGIWADGATKRDTVAEWRKVAFRAVTGGTVITADAK